MLASLLSVKLDVARGEKFSRKEVSQPDRERDKIGICHLSVSWLEISGLCFALALCITDVRLAWRRHAATTRGWDGSSETGVSRQFLGEYTTPPVTIFLSEIMLWVCLCLARL